MSGPMEPEDLSRSYAELMEQRGWQDQAPGNTGAPVEHESAAPPSVTRILEALLFVGGAPLSAAKACEIVRGLDAEQFNLTVEELNKSYRRQGRPYGIVPKDAGFVLALK